MVDESVVRSLCDVLGRTEDGLTNKEINELLTAAKVPDPTPPPTKHTYVAINKRDRLFRALITQQRSDGCGNAVLAFVGRLLHQSDSMARRRPLVLSKKRSISLWRSRATSSTTKGESRARQRRER
jgi:hypothetical protein